MTNSPNIAVLMFPKQVSRSSWREQGHTEDKRTRTDVRKSKVRQKSEKKSTAQQRTNVNLHACVRACAIDIEHYILYLWPAPVYARYSTRNTVLRMRFWQVPKYSGPLRERYRMPVCLQQNRSRGGA